MKYLRFFFLGGLVLALIMLLTSVILLNAFPPVLISAEFSRDIYPFALIAAFYAGSAFLFATIIKTGRTSKSKRDKFSGMLLVAALWAGLLTYISVISIATIYLHQNAPKESVVLEVVVTSAWPSRRLRADCSYVIMVNSPKHFSSVQSVCINDQQWSYFSDVEKPVSVILYGQKSYYGYELKCCK